MLTGCAVQTALPPPGAQGPILVHQWNAAGQRAVMIKARTLRQAGVRSIDLLVVADRSPALELPLAAGAELEWSELGLRPAAGPDGRTSVPWLRVAGSAAGRAPTDADPGAARSVGRSAASAPAADPDTPRTSADAVAASSPAAPGSISGAARPGAMLCFCEDVRLDELDAERRAGTTHPELLKRRTGALTGPCQGKLCLSAFAACAARGAVDGSVLPTSRPPLRPVRLGDLVVEEAE